MVKMARKVASSQALTRLACLASLINICKTKRTATRLSTIRSRSSKVRHTSKRNMHRLLWMPYLHLIHLCRLSIQLRTSHLAIPTHLSLMTTSWWRSWMTLLTARSKWESPFSAKYLNQTSFREVQLAPKVTSRTWSKTLKSKERKTIRKR